MSKYADPYELSFDREDIEKLRQKTRFLGTCISLFGAFLFSILFIVLSFLFTGYFRERYDLYRMFFLFGIGRIRARALLLIEPLFLVMAASMVAI
jgi:hypothetical protein